MNKCTLLGTRWLAGLLLALLPLLARAQAPAWQDAFSGNNQAGSGYSTARATAVDASGNVFVTGHFTGRAVFGTTQLVGLGSSPDVFLAKWDATTHAWAWAVAGGGPGIDIGYGIAVSGSDIFLTGYVTNSGTLNTSSTAGVQFGGVVLPSASTTSSPNEDVFLVKYTDGPTGPTYRWAVAGGGTSEDIGYGIAVSGSDIFLTGSVYNSTYSTDLNVQFGGVLQYSASSNNMKNADVFVAKYTDGPTGPTYRWAVVGGGREADVGYGIAVSGSDVFITGTVLNSATANVQFGLVLLPANGGGNNAFVLKYTDGPIRPTYRWAVVSAGATAAYGYAIAVRGSDFFITGYAGSGPTLSAQFGGVTLSSPVLSADVFLAKYTDSPTGPTCRWAVAGGGAASDAGTALAVSGSDIFVTGFVQNSGTRNASTNQNVQFGGVPLNSANTTGTVNYDLFVARYTDGPTGPTCGWALTGGSLGVDVGYGLAVQGQQVYAVGQVGTPAAIGSTTFSAAATAPIDFLARILDTTLTPLAVSAALPTGSFTVFPNPGAGGATLSGTAPGAAVRVLDATGRVVATATADAGGTARLVGLPAGLYLVRAGAATARLAVE